ncbi:MAG: putative endonuclease [Parcubacteria group bacterium Gr01-1014_46]|nr:MAG: putative endonuclease [Parcubacteria group bacterium Gr01-1014_46]
MSEYILDMYNKNFSKEPTDKQKIGQIGEDDACKYLTGLGYKVIERNYLKKWGEIDIVVKKGNKLHFVEVKSVSRDLSNVTRETNKGWVNGLMDAVRGGIRNRRGDVKNYDDENISYSNKEMRHQDDYRPEDNMHPWKLQRLSRAVQSYLLDRNVPDNVDWQFDVVTVHLDPNTQSSQVFLLEDLVL